MSQGCAGFGFAGCRPPYSSPASVKETAPAWGRVGPPNRTTDGGGRKFQSAALALDTAKRKDQAAHE